MNAAARNIEIPEPKAATAAAEAWITQTAPAPAEAPADPIKKLSLEFPSSVHRATKAGAALRGSTMLREILELVRARNGMALWPEDVVDGVLQQLTAADAVTWPASVVESVRKQIAAEEAASKPAPAKRARARGGRK